MERTKHIIIDAQTGEIWVDDRDGMIEWNAIPKDTVRIWRRETGRDLIIIVKDSDPVEIAYDPQA